MLLWIAQITVNVFFNENLKISSDNVVNSVASTSCLTVLQNKLSRMHHTSEFYCSSLCSFSKDDLIFSSNFFVKGTSTSRRSARSKNGNSENRISRGFMVIFKYWITECRMKITLIIFLPSLALPTLESCTPYHDNVLNFFYKHTL